MIFNTLSSSTWKMLIIGDSNDRQRKSSGTDDFQWYPPHKKSPAIKKSIRIMKLFVLFILAACLQVSARSSAQTVTFSGKDVSLQQALTAMKKQTGYVFIIDGGLLAAAKPVTVHVKDASLEAFLGFVLKDQQMEYIIKKKTIVISARHRAINNGFENSRTGAGVAYYNNEVYAFDVRGRVLDEMGNPIEGVTVNVKGSSVSVQSDGLGRYSISVPGNSGTLVFTHVAFVAQEHVIRGAGTLDITMVSVTSSLNSVVVVGYGVTKKKDLTGSVSQVSTQELESVPAYNVASALKGRAAGVRVVNNSGAPNSRVEVQIRGSNSMIGDNSPLFVVDGFPVTGDIQFLNPADIESMDILKDASSTAIYGSRGANGVIIITTKRGKQGQQGRIDIDSYYGMQEAVNRYEVLTAKEYAIVANEWSKNMGQPLTFDVNQVQDPGTDWQSYVFRKSPMHNHTITFSGGGGKTRYSLSANYFDQEGILINNQVKRGSVTLNLDHQVLERLNFGANITLSRREGYSVPVNNNREGLVALALGAAPTLPTHDENNVLTRTDTYYAFGSNNEKNPLQYLKPRKERFLSSRGLVSGFLEYTVIDGLKIRSQAGLEFDNTINELFIPIIWEGDLGSASDGYASYNSFLNENTVTYSKTIGEHSFNAVAGITNQSYNSRNAESSVQGLANNLTDNYNLASASIINVPVNGISEWYLMSFLGRANYTFRNRYLFTASVRRDGSSRFGANNKWGTFPSAAFAWRVSEEPFMKAVGSVSDLKLRASYGLTGSTALNPYQTIDRLSSNRVVVGNNTPLVGYAPAGLANEDLKWETTVQFDIGFDLSLFQGRVDVTFDYYKKITRDLLATVVLPPSVGFSSILQNVGEMENKGVEFMVSADVLRGNFDWTVTGQISANRNKLLKGAGDNSDILGGQNGHPFNSAINLGRIGYPLGVFYGFVEDGLDENGQINYVDVDENGVINTLDRLIIGDPYPDFIFSLNNSFRFKGFALDLFLEGSQGNDLFWETAGINLNSFQRGTNQFRDLIGNYWTAEKPNPNAKYPMLSAGTAFRVSDRFVKDGSYMRLKSARFSYDFSMTKVKWMSALQVYLMATNLFTITSYPGLDPDVNVAGTDDQNISNRLKVGLDKSTFPLARMIAVGIKASF